MGYVYHLPSKVSHQNIGCPCGAQPPGCPSPNSTRVDIWEDVQSFLRHSRAYLGRPFTQAPLKTLCMYATPAQTNVLPAQPSPALTSGHARPASSWPRTQPRAATTWRKIPSSTGPGNLDSRNPWPHPAPPSQERALAHNFYENRLEPEIDFWQWSPPPTPPPNSAGTSRPGTVC